MQSAQLTMFELPAIYECERKFLLQADRALAFWAIATERLQGRAPAGSPVNVLTTYFDTADLAYHRSSHGPLRRRLRVREYGAPGGWRDGRAVDGCYVELKQSFDGRRHKLRIAVPPDQAVARLESLAGAPVDPCVATWYRRRALTDPASRLRVTLDDGLLLCQPRPLGGALDLDPRAVLARGPERVLEVKFFDSPPTWVSDALAGIDEAVGFSKFLLGMSVLHRERELASPRRRLSCTG